jgi:predicted O-methyltransferase YrrM
MVTQKEPIFSQLETAVQNVPGWSPLDQLYSLLNLALISDVPGDIVELGSWCGRSAVALGMGAKLLGNVKVHCIDLFPAKNDWRKNSDGTYSFSSTINGKSYGAYEEQTVWAEPFERDIAPIYEKYDSVYDVFQETMQKRGLNQIVVPFKGDLELFAQSVTKDFKCKLAFIDGDHSYDAVRRDIELVSSMLSPGGWMCFDDAFSSYDGVNRAIEDCIIANSEFDRCQQLTRKFFVARKKS